MLTVTAVRSLPAEEKRDGRASVRVFIAFLPISSECNARRVDEPLRRGWNLVIARRLVGRIVAVTVCVTQVSVLTLSRSLVEPADLRVVEVCTQQALALTLRELGPTLRWSRLRYPSELGPTLRWSRL